MKYPAYIFIVIITILVAIYASKIVSTNYDNNSKEESVLLLPDLQKNIHKIGSVVFMHKGKTFVIKEQNGQWVIPGKYDYIVQIEKIRDLVQNSANIKIIEPKTKKAQYFKDLGLDNPENKDSQGVRIIFLSADGKTKYADYIRGKKRKLVKNAKDNEIYARQSDQNQTYLVDGNLNFDLSAHALLGGETFGVRSNRLRLVKFEYKNNPNDNFSIGKDVPGQLDFVMKHPLGAQITSYGKIEDIAKAPANIILDDIITKEEFTAIDDYDVSVTYQTFAGLIMNIKLFKLKDNRWITINAKTASKSDKQAQIDMQRINDLAKNWVYKVNLGSTSGLSYKLSDLIKN